MGTPTTKTSAEPATLKLRSFGEHTFWQLRFQPKLYKKGQVVKKNRTFYMCQNVDRIEAPHARMKYEILHHVSWFPRVVSECVISMGRSSGNY